MRANLKATRVLGWVCIVLTGWVCAPCRATAAELKYQAQLVWGTDDTKPPDGKQYKPVQLDIQKKLQELPLKWKNYFEVRRTDFNLNPTQPKKVPLSDKCELDIVTQSNATVEVALIGRGKEVVRRTQSLPKGDILVLGGNAPNSTAWLVILKRTD